ncbi:MAG: hypothetical protein ACTIJ6_08430 [Leucobacter sp.]
MAELHLNQAEQLARHPWEKLSRWSMTWRVSLTTLIAGMIGSVACSLMVTGGLAPLPGMSLFLVLGIPFLCAALSAVIAPWLRRFDPVVQSLLMGVIAIVAMVLIVLVLPHTGGSSSDVMFALYLFGLPTGLVSSIGFGLAIWSSTRYGKECIWRMGGITFALYGTLLALAFSGILAQEREEGYSGPVCESYSDAAQGYTQYPCGEWPTPTKVQ